MPNLGKQRPYIFGQHSNTIIHIYIHSTRNLKRQHNNNNNSNNNNNNSPKIHQKNNNNNN